MTDARRIGNHPNRFSREIRSEKGGGTIDDRWGCRVVDLDEFYAVVDGVLFRVRTSGRVWAWYREPVEIVAVAEQKSYDDLQQSWDVTRSFAVMAGVEGFRVVRLRDDRRQVTDIDCSTRDYDTTREFVEQRIKPLIQQEEYPF